VVAGIGMATTVAPTTLAVLMLLPLSAFEATVPLPAAAIQLTRSRLAAHRLLDLTPVDTGVRLTRATPMSAAVPPHPLPTVRLCAMDVCAGHQGSTGSAAVTVNLAPGTRLAVSGPSGSGKTTLLMTLAGLLPPLGGEV